MLAVFGFALQDGLPALDPLHGGGGPEEDLLGSETAGAGVEDHAAGLLVCLRKGLGLRREEGGRKWARTVAAGASRRRGVRWVDAASRAGRARRAGRGLRYGIGVGPCSPAR